MFPPNQPVANTPPPNLKPACSSYTTAYNVIAQRQTFQCYSILLAFSIISTLLLQLTQMTWPTWKTLIYILVLWSSLVVLLHARLDQATFQRKVARSLRFDIHDMLAQRETWIQLCLYTTFSLLLVSLSFILICQTTIPNRQQRYHGGAKQLNVERLYVFLYACLLGVTFSLYRTFIQRWVIQWQVVQQHPLYLVKSSVRAHLKTPLCWSFSVFGASYLVYILFSGLFYALATRLVGIFFSVLDRPILGFRWWDVVLFYQMVMMGGSIIGSWLFVDGLVDAYFNRVQDCISPYSNSMECLMDGLRRNKRDRLEVHAFAELARLTSNDAVKRKDIYHDMENTVSMWSLIRTECLSSVNELTTRIKNEYNDKKPQDALKPKEPVTKKSPRSIQLVNGNVLAQRQPQTSTLDDRTTSVLTQLATRASDAIPSPDIHLGQLTNRVWTMFKHSKVGQSITSTRLDGVLGHWGHYLCDETRNRKIHGVIGNPLIQISSIQALSNLVVFSLKEDDIGLVQYDIPSVLNTFLGCVDTLDKYLVSPPPHYLQLSTGPDHLHAPYQLKLALDNALFEIKWTFKDHLDDFAVQDTFAARWDRY